MTAAPDTSSDLPAHLRAYQRFHLDQGWPDIAYHVAVGRAGLLWQLRDPAIAGDTFTDYDPSSWLLVLADGNFSVEDPTEQQLDGLARAVAWAAGAFDVSLDRVVAHRDRAETDCPGERLARYLDDGSLQERAAALLDDGGVDAPVVCGDDADELLVTAGLDTP